MSEAPEPEQTALYRVYGGRDLRLLYVGVSNDFGHRWKQHASSKPWWGEKRILTVEFLDSRPAAEAAEKAAIRTEGPEYNIAHADCSPQPPRPLLAVPPLPAAPALPLPSPRPSRVPGLTDAEFSRLPTVADLPDAARVLRLGQSEAWELARTGEFPCRIIRVGKSYRVPIPELIQAPGIDVQKLRRLVLPRAA